MVDRSVHGSAGRQRGSVLPLMAFGLVGVVVMTLLLGALGQRTLQQSRAQSAADAAALAGVVEGRSGAEELARRNGGRLVEFDRLGDAVRVVIDYGGVLAEAGAERRLAGSLGGCTSSRCSAP